MSVKDSENSYEMIYFTYFDRRQGECSF